MKRQVFVLCMCHSVPINTVCDKQNLCILCIMYLMYYVSYVLRSTHIFQQCLLSKLFSYIFFSKNKYFYRCQKRLTVFVNINKNVEFVALHYRPINNNNNKLGRRYKMDVLHVQVEIWNAYKYLCGEYKWAETPKRPRK